jgi:hypothetical protein
MEAEVSAEEVQRQSCSITICPVIALTEPRPTISPAGCSFVSEMATLYGAGLLKLVGQQKLGRGEGE